MMHHDIHLTHNDSKHKAMCENSFDENFIVGRVYDATQKEECWIVKGEKESRKVSKREFKKHFNSFITI